MASLFDRVKICGGPRAIAGLRRAGTAALDLAYPPQCLGCGAPVAAGDGLCGTCWQALEPISAPMCPRLGLPFAYDMGPDALSAEAIADPPPFGRARAPFVYNRMARQLVGELKYRDRPELARFAARAMAQAGADLLSGEVLLVPVPLHRWRLWRRRYNQAAELVRALVAETGLTADCSLARRVRPTRQQVGLNARQRARNVAGAFAAHPEALGRIAGRRLVLVDDVLTTGATVDALTRCLMRAGADQIDVLSFARVVIGREGR